MMVRAQFTLDAKLRRRAEERAAESDLSFAEYVRRLLERELGEPPPTVDPSLVFNLGSSGGSDVAREKASMLVEAVAAECRRKN